jgi:hypothetical protein
VAGLVVKFLLNLGANSLLGCLPVGASSAYTCPTTTAVATIPTLMAIDRGFDGFVVRLRWTSADTCRGRTRGHGHHARRGHGLPRFYVSSCRELDLTDGGSDTRSSSTDWSVASSSALASPKTHRG